MPVGSRLKSLLSKLVAVGILLAAPITCVRVDRAYSCLLPGGAKSISLFRDAPQAIQQAFKSRFGDIAESYEPFDKTDVMITGRFRRLIFIWNAGERWVVATERGGIGYHTPIFAFDLGEDRLTATLVNERVGDVCKTATSFLQCQTCAMPP
jgi:hypothetical protein